MAGTDKPGADTGRALPAFTTGEDHEEVTSVSMDRTNGGPAKAITRNQEATSVVMDGNTAAPKVEGGEGGEPENKEAPAALEAEGTEAADLEPLGEYTPDNPEVQAKFDERYYTKEGDLNKNALSKEFWKNYKAAADDKKGEAGLDEPTYAYLKSTLGLPKATVKEIERALLAEAELGRVSGQQRDAKVLERIGGAERYNAALAWGKAGGYTEAQRTRFNELRDSGNHEAFEEAIDALMFRFEKAGTPGFKSPRGGEQRRGPPQQQQRNRQSPERSATEGGGGTEGKTAEWKTYGEYQKAFAEAIQAKNLLKGAERRKAEQDINDMRQRARKMRFPQS